MPVDLPMFRSHFGRPGGSATELVLRGHLWIEAQLNKLLLAYVANPDALDLDRTGFGAKVMWADAIGAIDAVDVPWYKALNKARNRLAHKLGGEPSRDDLGELLRPMRPELQDAAEGMWDADPDQARAGFGNDPAAPDTRLRAALMMHIVALEHRAMLEKWRSTYAEQLQRVAMKRALHAVAYGDDEAWTDAKEREARETWGVPEPPEIHDATGVRPSQSS